MPTVTRSPEPKLQPGMWIDGEERPTVDGATFTTPDPATGATLADLPRGTSRDVELAVSAAQRAFRGWAATDPNERARLLWKLGEAVLHAAETLARLEALDTGKPIANARLIDVPRTADTFFYFSGWATKIHGETIPVRGPFLQYTLREPLGVIGAIIPWNFPLLLAARKIAPALAAGNVVIVKPPEEASLTTLMLGKLAAEVGFPPGVLQIVTGFGEEAGAALVAHPGVAKISFTGGTDTGKRIARDAAATLKRVSLELGGKSPNILFADADLEVAARAAVSAAFYNQGELCTAGSRILVERRVLEPVLEILSRGTSELVVGDSLDPATQIGPMVSDEHAARVRGFITRASAAGARQLTGGAPDTTGCFVAPTVFAGVDPSLEIAREEVFGPVVTVMPFDDVDHAARLADATDYGLAAGIWTRDIARAHSLAARIRSGTVWINTYNRFDAASPYGGTKQSGYGRENGAAVLDEVTQRKSVWVSLA